MLVRDMTISMGEQVHMCKANVHDNGRGVEFHLSDSQQVLVHPGGLGVELRSGTGGEWLCAFQQKSSGGEYAVFVSRSTDGLHLLIYGFRLSDLVSFVDRSDLGCSFVPLAGWIA